MFVLPMNLQFFAEPEPTEPKEPEVTPVDPVGEPDKEPTPAPEPTPEEVETPTPPKPEEPKPEPKPDPTPKEDDPELVELKRKLAEAETFKAQYEASQESLKGYEASLTKIVEQKIEAVPEAFRELIPEGTTQDRLDWLSKAEKTGLFSVKEEKSIGQSTKVNDHVSNKVELKDMTTNQKLVAGFTDYFSKK